MIMIRDILKKECGYDVRWNGNERGDYSVNVVDSEKAKKIKKKLFKSEYISKIETAGGFINFWLSEKALKEGVEFSLRKNFGFVSGKVQVEFISANPTGPLTLGNGRGGVYGDVLANILKLAGYDVTKEYYVNDAGNQIEILKETIQEGKGAYEKFVKDAVGSKDVKEVLASILKGIKKTTSDMGIEFDEWFSEQEKLRDTRKVEEIIKWLNNSNQHHDDRRGLGSEQKLHNHR